MLMSGAVERIVLSRPAVEAGERLGFLPGDLRERMRELPRLAITAALYQPRLRTRHFPTLAAATTSNRQPQSVSIASSAAPRIS